ncbi:conserved hypothetical protein [Perkinsus marinus ATCC 50983]|uniref:CRAL-TRIO domain-containing protein n=1 Tax=Perkinsus marinus (strain ATCC 50983 / TXsc) TaxID=423536 RepID=C5LC47_PERM5|nr:conserved hypothetical protein [Perkinsus marinus ATCC 50983]EER05530.1 conserved hypothetical protein [Perkinsus marinus ATCC 50983]|eukprot:XP_002773714.1 conserved hypothetical protein [Perkinsus marinus ATCC 50983]
MFTRFKGGDYERRILLNVELMPQELEAIDEVYKTLEARKIVLARQLEPRILRYLYHTRFDVGRAVKELLETEKWRLEFFKKPIRDADILRELNSGFLYVSGRDKQYRPCVVVRPSLLVKENISKENAIRTSVFLMEFITRYMLLASKVESVVMIVDFSGVGLSAPYSTAFALYKVLAYHYVGRMAAIYIVNLPTFMRTIVGKLAHRLMTERQLQKNHIVTDLKQHLAKYFDPNQLERRYGGVKPNIEQLYPITHLSSKYNAKVKKDELLKHCHVCLGLPTVRGQLWRRGLPQEPLRFSREALPLFEALGLGRPEVMLVGREDSRLAVAEATEGRVVPEGTVEDVRVDEFDHLLRSSEGRSGGMEDEVKLAEL